MIAAVLLSASGAAAASVSGPNALALAALVADHSPLIGTQQKLFLRKLLEGTFPLSQATPKKLMIQADSVICRSSNIDIVARSCKMTFGQLSVSIDGRRAHELEATIAQAGAASEGAAGSVFTGLTHLSCTIAPEIIRQKAGGGADCTFDADAP